MVDLVRKSMGVDYGRKDKSEIVFSSDIETEQEGFQIAKAFLLGLFLFCVKLDNL